MKSALALAIDAAKEAGEVLEDNLDESPELAPVEYFTIESDDKAAWAVNRLLGFDEEEARIRAQFHKAIADLERRRESFEERFVPELEAFFPSPVTGGASHVDLTTGRVQWRKVPAIAVLEDTEDARERVAAWLEEKELPFVERIPQPDRLEIDHVAVKANVKAGVAARLEDVAAALEDGRAEEFDEAAIERAIADVIPDGMKWKPESYAFSVEAPK